MLPVIVAWESVPSMFAILSAYGEFRLRIGAGELQTGERFWRIQQSALLSGARRLEARFVSAAGKPDRLQDP